MDRVVAEHQRVGMFDRAAEYERRIAARANFDAALAFCKHRELSGADLLGGQQPAPIYRQPCHVVAARRAVVPWLSVLEADMEVVDALWCADRAASAAMGAEQYPHRAFLFDGFGWNVLALRRRVLLGGGQRHPQLEAAHRRTFERTAVMPDAVTCPHPFETAFSHLAALARRVFVGEATLQYDRQGCDAGVRVNSEQGLSRVPDFRVVQEYKGLDQLADIERTGKTRDRTVPVPAG